MKLGAAVGAIDGIADTVGKNVGVAVGNCVGLVVGLGKLALRITAEFLTVIYNAPALSPMMPPMPSKYASQRATPLVNSLDAYLPNEIVPTVVR